MTTLTSGLMSILIIATVSAATVSAIPVYLMRRSKHEKAKLKACGYKCIDISNLFFWFIYGVGGAFTVLGIGVFLLTDEPGAGITFMGLGLIFICLAAILYFLDTTVTWNSESISGAQSGVSFKKNTLQWADVVSVDILPNKTFQLEDKSGKYVHWTAYQSGWFEIIKDLRRFNPSVDTSEFE